ncbi:GntR family transcriptional regulator [Curvivirga sp.]|uniref:GntR family transcriptional regulator n=1 Tax=Curvivirga sp. TaxID=2856848 RepID=UPI003B5B4FD5
MKIAEKGKRNQDNWIYQEVFDAILEQRLAPGTKLSEDALGEVFGVSRTVIRKVLLRLSHEKIVAIRPNRGAVVSIPSIKEAKDTFDARRWIERGVVRRACETISKADIGILTKLVQKEHEAYADNNKSEGIQLSGAFHLKLAEIAGNETLQEYLKELVTRSSLIVAHYENNSAHTCTHNDHKDLITALAEGNSDKAVALMEDHLQAIEDKLNLSDADSETNNLKQIFSSVAINRTDAHQT